MFEIDLGATGSDVNTYLQWSARGTQDGAVRAKQFYIRDGAAKDEFESARANGFIIDLSSLKTGWQKSDGMIGVAPEWKWNPSVNQMMAKPGDDYKKGFSVKCAIGSGKVAMWEQAGAGVWAALTELAPKLSQIPEGKAARLQLVDTKDIKFTKGGTCVPIFEVTAVDKPDSLKEGAAAGIALEAPAATPAPAPAPAAAPPADAEF